MTEWIIIHENPPGTQTHVKHVYVTKAETAQEAADSLTTPGNYLVMPAPHGPSDDVSYEIRRYKVALAAIEEKV